MNKPMESTAGTVVMADGTRRFAYRNTYKITRYNTDGSVGTPEQDVSIEFLLDTNANAMVGRRYRKTTSKQAATFEVLDV